MASVHGGRVVGWMTALGQALCRCPFLPCLPAALEALETTLEASDRTCPARTESSNFCEEHSKYICVTKRGVRSAACAWYVVLCARCMECCVRFVRNAACALHRMLRALCCERVGASQIGFEGRGMSKLVGRGACPRSSQISPLIWKSVSKKTIVHRDLHRCKPALIIIQMQEAVSSSLLAVKEN